jgi:hypothetical protein
MAKGHTDEENFIPRVEYSEEEMKYRDMLIRRCDHANNQRQQKWVELDDMDYETWWWKSKKAIEAYIEPKKNKEDVKVVTGTTREKNNTLVATLLNYNLEADLTAFDDKDQANVELGQTMEAMVRKSRRLEMPEYEDKRPLIYKELAGMGNVFIEEQLVEYKIPEKDLDDLDWSEGIDPKKIKWKEKLNKTYSYCNSSMLCGLDVFPGNMREFHIELQPYIVLRRRRTRAEMEAVYGEWTRWKNVPKELTYTAGNEDSGDYDDYQMIKTEVDFVEEIKYFDKWKNEFMIMLNGVMMLPAGFPLSALTGVCEYPISKGDAEPISANFFYSRGIGSKTRMDQAMMDEMFKMMLVKTRKSFKPPIVNNTGQNISSKIYLPGTIWKNLDPDKIKQIGEATGVTPAEFNMTQFIKQVIDSKTMASIMEGQQASKGTTAREIVEMKQQSMVKIGMVMLGVVNLEKRMAWLRIYNILRNWTKPVDKRMEEVEGKLEEVNEYRTVDVEDEFENGQKGRRVIEMTDKEPLPQPEQVMAEEEVTEYYTGEKIRKTYINPKVLQSLKYKWQVNIEPTEKQTGMLKAAKYEEFLQKVMAIFAPLGKMPNVDYAADRMALLNDENPEQFWQAPQPQMPQMPGMPGQEGGGMPPEMGGQPIPNELAAQLTGGGAGEAQPDLSLNSLVNG